MKVFLAVSTLIAVAATGLYHIRQIQVAVQAVPQADIITTSLIPNSLAQSIAVSVVNPKKHPSVQDSRHITVHVPNGLSDETLLASFVSGFFGGHVFALERGILKVMRKQISHFNAIQARPISLQVWSIRELSSVKLPPLDALLFGAFRVVDIQLAERESYIDFAFGSDDGAIAGVHRFSVAGHPESHGRRPRGTRAVSITFAHSGCNPRENKPLGPEMIQSLHLWYAMLLFREGVAKTIKNLRNNFFGAQGAQKGAHDR